MDEGLAPSVGRDGGINIGRGLIVKLTKDTVKALTQAAQHLNGQSTKVRVTRVQVKEINVRVIREKLNLSQQVFADRYGFPVSTLRNWEQGRRQPEGAARVLLKLIDSKPEVVEQALYPNVHA